jgi:DNA-directed RNA polymerase subunit L
MSSSSSSKIRNAVGNATSKPIISQHNNNNEFTLTFTLENCDVSIVNALRRIILSDINQYVFRTFPHSENRAEFTVNTTRLHNEILKQRLGCIPIHHLHTIDGIANEYKNYVVEVDVKNETDTIRYVTTEDFKVKKAKAIEKTSGRSKNEDTDEDVMYDYLPEATVRKIFPPDAISGEYIEFARLLPNISSSNSNSGEALAFTCTLEISNAKFDGMYNVAHTCAYSCTPDTKEIDKQWKAKEKIIREGFETSGSTESSSSIDDHVENEKKNWELLEAQRIFIPNSFDFIIETVGVYTNVQLVTKACDIMIKKCEKLLASLEHAAETNAETNATTTVEYAHELTTMKNSFRVNLVGEDYTLGKVIEFYIFSNYYNRPDGIVSFCGFKKPHPHALDSYIIVSFKDEMELSKVQELISKVVLESISVFKSLFESFNDFKSKK